MNCPECGKEMEEGVINTDGNIISWTKGALSLKGDTLTWGVVFRLMEHRCALCRSILVRY